MTKAQKFIPFNKCGELQLLNNGDKIYHVYSLYDNSNRFNDPTDFNDCNSPGWIPLIINFRVGLDYNQKT